MRNIYCINGFLYVIPDKTEKVSRIIIGKITAVFMKSKKC